MTQYLRKSTGELFQYNGSCVRPKTVLTAKIYFFNPYLIMLCPYIFITRYVAQNLSFPKE